MGTPALEMVPLGRAGWREEGVAVPLQAPLPPFCSSASPSVSFHPSVRCGHLDLTGSQEVAGNRPVFPSQSSVWLPGIC